MIRDMTHRALAEPETFRRRALAAMLRPAAIFALMTAVLPNAASAVPVYETAGPDPTTPEATPAITRLAFGFGASRLVYPECSRAGGARRCHPTVIRSFANRPASRTLPCCHRVLVGGQLTDRAGNPLPGETVDVVERFARGAQPPRRTTADITDRRGFFRTWLAPGPSRRVSVEFPGNDNLSGASGRRLRLRVRAMVRMQVSSSKVRVGGAPVIFSGRVAHPGARLPPTGLFVELEFRLPGMAWEEFRTLQTRSGRFSYPYTFQDDDSAGVRFLFRAFVPATGEWSFAPSVSRPQAVTG